jgi:hypothetical protein
LLIVYPNEFSGKSYHGRNVFPIECVAKKFTKFATALGDGERNAKRVFEFGSHEDAPRRLRAGWGRQTLRRADL